MQVNPQFLLIFGAIIGLQFLYIIPPVFSERFETIADMALSMVGFLLGVRIGSHFSRADQQTKNWMGVALLPQAGVAIGMALIASSYFPAYRQTLLSVVIGSTVFFELIGPVFTRQALRRVQRV